MPNHCPVCRMAIRDTVAVCHACDTPHHPECWEFGRGCAVFACGSERARVLEAAAYQPAVVEVVLDGTEADPPWYRAQREPRFELPLVPSLPPPGPCRESGLVVLVSWLYLGLSLILAIPSVGFAVRALSGEPEMLLAAIGWAALAAGLKLVGDLIAVGDRHGRAAHGGLTAVVALAAGSAGLTLLLIASCVPFWTRRGQVHFGVASRG